MIMAGETTERAPLPEPTPERRGFRTMFGVEHALKRQFAGGPRRPGIPSVMIDAFNIMQDRIARARLAGDPPDVMINPRAGHLGWFDFHRAPEAIEAGAPAAQRALGAIGDAPPPLSPRPATVPPAVK